MSRRAYRATRVNDVNWEPALRTTPFVAGGPRAGGPGGWPQVWQWQYANGLEGDFERHRQQFRRTKDPARPGTHPHTTRG